MVVNGRVLGSSLSPSDSECEVDGDYKVGMTSTEKKRGVP